MKYLSFILAISVLLLSVIPCCFEDKCFSIHTETQNTGDDTSNACDDCSDNNYSCCSPFLHCNTCTGFPEARVYKPKTIALGLVSECNSDYVFKGDLPGFISSIWQPPQA